MHLTDKQLQTLRHMLGIDRPRERDPQPYRDYYCASRGDVELAALATAGAVRMYRQSGQCDWYTTTEAGRAAAIESHRKIRLPKAKRRYAKFLEISDVQSDLTFHRFLTSPEYADVRANA